MKRIEDLNKTEMALVINQKLKELEDGIERGLLDYESWKKIVDISYSFLQNGGRSKLISGRFTRMSNKVTEIMREEKSNFIIIGG